MSMNLDTLQTLDWAAWTHVWVQALAMPEVGLGAIFVVALVSATLVPMGSEPAVWALVRLQPELFWPAILVATVGNTLGGAITWWMGRGAQLAWARARAGHAHQPPSAIAPEPEHNAARRHAQAWLRRWGAPLCAVAGWLRLPFWPCLAWMAVGKFFRYLAMTAALMQFF